MFPGAGRMFVKIASKKRVEQQFAACKKENRQRIVWLAENQANIESSSRGPTEAKMSLLMGNNFMLQLTQVRVGRLSGYYGD